MASDDDCGGYDSCGDDGDYGSYDGDDGYCYDDSGNQGSYDDEAGHYVDYEDEEDYGACEEECEESYAPSQECEDSDASRYDNPTYSSCDEFEHDDSDVERMDDEVDYTNCAYASSLGVACGEQESSRGPSVSMGGGGGCSMGNGRLASSSSHVNGGRRNGIALTVTGVHCSSSGGRSGAMGYGTKARGNYGFHSDTTSLTSNNTSNVGGVTGSGGYSSGVATSGGIRKTRVDGNTSLGHSSSSLDVPIRNLGRSRFVVGVNRVDGNLLQIGGTDANCINPRVVQMLNIPCHDLKYPYEYKGVRVFKEARVLISHKGYNEYVWCDVYPVPNVGVWLGDPWLHNKEVHYDAKRDLYLVATGQGIYEFAPYGKWGKMSVEMQARIIQRRRERELQSMGNNVQTRSPTNTSNGGTSSTKELTNVNKVSPKPLPKPSGSPTKKKETSSDESLSPRFRVDVKSQPTPAMGILGPRPNSPEFVRQKIERSKGVTGDIPRVEKGEDVMSDVSGMSPPESTPNLEKKMREKKEGKKSEDTTYSNLNPLSFPPTFVNACVGTLGGQSMEPQSCSEIEGQGEEDLQCELQGEGTTHDTSSALSALDGHSKKSLQPVISSKSVSTLAS